VKHLLLVLMVLLGPATHASSQSAAPGAAANPEPRQLGDNAMKFIARDDIAGLFKYLGAIMPMEKDELDKIRDNIVGQRKGVTAKIGASVGYALISECRKSDTLSRLIYAEKRAKSVMRWQFIFYKPRDKWTLIYFFWDDKHPEFFEPCN
jgi:hypothetical protein